MSYYIIQNEAMEHPTNLHTVELAILKEMVAISDAIFDKRDTPEDEELLALLERGEITGTFLLAINPKFKNFEYLDAAIAHIKEQS